MEVVLVGLVVGLVVGWISARRRRHARRVGVLAVTGDESGLGLPSRLRDPETGEFL